MSTDPTPAEIAVAAYDAAINDALGNPPGTVIGPPGRHALLDHPPFAAMLAAHERAVLLAAGQKLRDRAAEYPLAESNTAQRRFHRHLLAAARIIEPEITDDEIRDGVIDLLEGMAERRTAPTTTRVLREVSAERRAQDAKWGEQRHPDAHPAILGRLTTGGLDSAPDTVARRLAEWYEIPTASRAKFTCDHEASTDGGRTWVGIAVEELAEVLEATTQDPSSVRKEAIQLAAVMVAMVEDIDRRDTPAPVSDTEQG